MHNIIKRFTKKLDQKGFTLMEMLIVVAIIAILVAVSIPMFTSQLDNARKSADQANLRAAKAVASTYALTEDEFTDATKKLKVGMYYDADTGTFIDGEPSTNYSKSKANEGKYVKLTAYDTSTGEIKVEWQVYTSSSSG